MIGTPIRGLALAGALTCAFALGACGDDGNSAPSATNASGGSGGSAVADAKAVIAKAQDGLVYATTRAPTRPSQILPYGQWRGPTSAPKPKTGMNVQVITCSKQAPGCTVPAQAAVEAANALGWKADVVDGAGTPEGFARAFDTALGRHPDAIITVALSTSLVGDSLAKAKAQGVLTEVLAETPPPASYDGPRYSAYVSFPTVAENAIAAWKEIADQDGHARVLLIRDGSYQLYLDGVAEYQRIFKTCSGCSTKVIDWQLTDALDPGKVNQIVGGAVSADPKLTSIFAPYGAGLPNVTQAVASTGRSGLVLGSQLGDAISVQSVAAGDSAYTVGNSGGWAGWAAIDQVSRGLAGKPYLSETEMGVGIGLMTKKDASPKGDFDTIRGMVDYRAEYKKIWGLD